MGMVKELEDFHEHYNKIRLKELTPGVVFDKNNFIIYCARGCMRSKGFQNIINNKKYKTLRLKSGYIEIRNHVLNSFKEQRKDVVIAGSTGTGKTTIINKMRDKGHDIIDLEKLALEMIEEDLEIAKKEKIIKAP